MKLIQLQHRTYIMDSANLENYAWIYVHEDDWDQDGVLLETWFLADYNIQNTLLGEGIINFRMAFFKIP